jgi:alkanesulfonate monooxygenase SsuD/methylene tetrahydromethanopterin reductase-like flavin-dependent oxidoreductase (luciferase family)
MAAMRIATVLPPTRGPFSETAKLVVELERVGVDIVLVDEGYTLDAVSRIGYLAAKTERITIGAGILNIYSRTPTALGQTAAGCDYVSNGRFLLGLGASGPQVIEGFHGVLYEAPAPDA